MSTTQTHSSATLLDAFAARFVNRARPYAVQQRGWHLPLALRGHSHLTRRWRICEGELTLALSSSDEAGSLPLALPRCR